MTTKEILWTIKTTRRKMDMTQQEVADKCGILRQSYERIENGRTSPNLSTLIEICKRLNLEITITQK